MFVQFGACLLIEDNFLHSKKNLWLFCIINSVVNIKAVNRSKELYMFFLKNDKNVLKWEKPQIYHMNLNDNNYEGLSYWLLENYYNESVESHPLS